MKSASIPKDPSNVWITRVPQITKKYLKGKSISQRLAADYFSDYLDQKVLLAEEFR